MFWKCVAAWELGSSWSLTKGSHQESVQAFFWPVSHCHSGIMESEYVDMNRIRSNKIARRKSLKKVRRKVSVNVKRKRSIVKRNPSQRKVERRKVGRCCSVRKSKSFIVKRKSFKAPKKWSEYIRASEQTLVDQKNEGTLPRVKGFWNARKYKHITIIKVDTFDDCDRIMNLIKLLNSKDSFRIPRPKFGRPRGEDVYQNQRYTSSSDSGICSSVSGYSTGKSSTNRNAINSNNNNLSCGSVSSWRNLILKEDENELVQAASRIYQKSKNHGRKRNVRESYNKYYNTAVVNSYLASRSVHGSSSGRCWDVYQDISVPTRRLRMGSKRWPGYQRERDMDVLNYKPERLRYKHNLVTMDLWTLCQDIFAWEVTQGFYIDNDSC